MGLLELLFILILFGFIRTWWVQNSKEQKEFLKGKVPQKLDGFYKGTVEFSQTTWLGKVFHAKDKTGVNRLAGGDKYPFRTYQAKGLQDSNLDVLRVDYDIPQNSWLVRRVADEIVEVDKDKLLGKAHLRIIPGVVFSLVYFRLEKH